MKEFIRTGAPQTFDSTEIVGFTSDFDHLLPPMAEQSGRTLSVRPSSADGPSIPCRIRFGSEHDSVTIDYILLTRTRAGTDQLTFESTGLLPFHITLTIGKDGSGALRLRDTSVGQSVHEIQRYLRALRKAFHGEIVEFYDLGTMKTFVKVKISSQPPDWLPDYSALIDSIVSVADEYKVQLKMPTALTLDDDRNLLLLSGYAHGCQIEISEISFGLTKGANDVQSAVPALTEECSYYIVTSSQNFCVFGTNVSTGPIEYVIGRARVKNAPEVREHFEKSPLGATVEMILAPVGPVTASRHQDSSAHPIIRFQRLSGPEPIENPN